MICASVAGHGRRMPYSHEGTSTGRQTGAHARLRRGAHVKGRADDAGILAEPVDGGHGEVDGLEGAQDFVLALDHVCGGDELAGRLLPQDKPLPARVDEQERRVRLPDLELPHLQRRRQVGHLAHRRALQRRDIERMSGARPGDGGRALPVRQ